MYKSLASYYKEIFPLKAAATSFIRPFLKGNPCRVLDIGCAVGQLAAALARDGHEVTGIDLDAAMIETAKQDAAGRGLKIEFKVMNMMDVAAHFAPRTFDMVLCLGNTPVHLSSAQEIGAFIKKVSGILKQGGMFILQVVNYDRVLAGGITELPVIDTEHIRFERHYIYDRVKQRMRFRTCLTVKEDMGHLEDEVLLYPLTHRELDLLLRGAGFNDVVYYGDFSAHEYTIESLALIAVSG